MKKCWNINVNGINHTITYEAMFGLKLTVDNQTQKLKSSSYFANLIDHPFNIDGTDCRIVAIGRDVDLAVNGVYQNSGKPYVPTSNIPGWVTALAAISLILGAILSGLLGGAVGALLGSFYFATAAKGKLQNAVIAFVLGTIGQIVFSFGLAFIFAILL